MSEWQPPRKGEWRLPAFCPQRPEPRQAVFLGLHHIREAMYGGAAGGGKSSALLMDAMQYWDVPKYSAVIIRRSFADLNKPGAIMDRAKAWLIPEGIAWHEGRHEFTFPSGARLTFAFLQNPRDRYKFQSAEYQYIGLDEGTQFEESEYTYLLSRLRRPEDVTHGDPLGRVPLRARIATNPGNIGHEWVKARFIPFVDEQGAAHHPKDRSGKPRVFVPARLTDNPHLDAESYAENLQELDDVEKARLLDGNWGVRPPGEMFDSAEFRYAYWLPDDNCWTDAEMGVKFRIRRWVRFWDLASTKKRSQASHDPDYTVGVLMGLADSGDVLTRDVVRFRDRPAVVTQRILETAKTDRDTFGCRTIRIEQEGGSSGEFTTDQFRRLLMGYDFDGVRPTGPKAERARTLASYSGGGRFWIVSGAPWVPEYISELHSFPNEGIHDDQVDGSSGAFEELAGTGPAVGGSVAPSEDHRQNPYNANRSDFLSRRRSRMAA